MFRLMLLFILGLCWGAPVFGQVLTLEEAVAQGLAHSASLQATRRGADLAAARTQELRTLRRPVMTAGTAYRRLSDVPPFNVTLPFGDPPQTVTVSPTLLNQYNLQISLQQPLFTGHRLTGSIDASAATTLAAQAEVAATQAAQVLAIREAYWNLYRAQELEKIVQENARQVAAHLRDARQFLAAGLVLRSEVTKVEVQEANVALNQVSAANAVRLARARLNSLIGRSLEAPTQPAEPGPPPPTLLLEATRLVEEALARRPELQSLAHRMYASEAARRVARAGRYPQVYATGSYLMARPNPRYLPTRDAFRDTWDVGLAVSFDLWNSGRTGHQEEQARLQRLQLDDQARQVREAITLEVTQAILAVQEGLARITAAEVLVRSAEEHYQLVQSQFRNQVALSTDLLDAEVALFQARAALTIARVDDQLARARLDKALGR